MNIETATPLGATVDAPASMDDILSEFETGSEAPGDTEKEVVKELVGEAEEGDSGTPEANEDDTTEGQAAEESAGTEPEEATEEGTTEPEPTFKVKVNGEEIEVPQSELLKGYSRERDYTAKTMALAEEKRTLEATLSARYADELEQQVKLFEQLDPILSQADQIDWQALAASDPAAYVQLKAAVDERRAAVTDAKRKIDEQRGKETEAEEAKRLETAAAETKALVDKLPELADETAMKAFAGNAVNYLRATGFEDGEIADLTDHRALLIIDKARRWDEAQKARTALPARRVVPRSEVKPLKSDGSGSSAPKPRFPARAPRERQLEHVVNEILQQE